GPSNQPPMPLEIPAFAVETILRYNMTVLESQPPIARICVRLMPAAIAAPTAETETFLPCLDTNNGDSPS
ncbi:29914_t:CDS:2, partial [Racocetra persica]